MRYEDVPERSPAESLELTHAGDPRQVVMAILSLVFDSPDRVLVQDRALELMDHQDHYVRRAAVQAISHLVWIHKEIDTERVTAKMNDAAARDEQLRSYVDDALGDIASLREGR